MRKLCFYHTSCCLTLDCVPEQAAEAVVAAVEHVVTIDHPEEASPVILSVYSPRDLLKLLCPRLVQLAAGEAVGLAVTVHSGGAEGRPAPHRASEIWQTRRLC